MLHLLCPLPVNFKNNVVAQFELAFYPDTRGAVQIAKNPRVFKELIALQHGEKVVLCDKVVVDAVLLAGPDGSRGVGD